ncbi:MAG: ABC transporter permease [Nitrospinota bacterium]|nr:ABC transporter permease [Nitrospinota bacterium]
MKIFSTLKITLTALMSHKTRTFLASLGVMIGIAAVIVMVAIGKGSQKEVMDVIAGMGENLITIQAGEMKMRGGRIRFTGNVTTMSIGDSEILKDTVFGLEKVAPFEIKSLQVKYKSAVAETNIAGSNTDFPDVRLYRVEHGRFFDEKDLKTSRRVAVIGPTAVKNIFGEEDPVGQTIRIKSIPFKIIGVFAVKGLDTNGTDQDDIILVPITTLMRRILNQTYINTIYVKADRRENIQGIVQEIRDVIRREHRIREEKEDDFSIVSQLDIEELKRETSEMFTRLIVGVAAISLIVGGVGILAVMLISVKERTREIGVRRAVGATRRDVIRQFLMESVTIGLLGGGVGITLGVGLTLALTRWGPWTLLLDVPAIFIATAVCLLIGTVFGIFPAVKASRLDPMESLTVE